MLKNSYHIVARDEKVRNSLFIHFPLMDVLIHLGCYHNISKWVAHKQKTFIAHISGGWKSKVPVPACSDSGESCLLGSRLLASYFTLTLQKGQGSFLRLLYKGTDPVPEGLPNYLPKVTVPPNTIILKV